MVVQLSFVSHNLAAIKLLCNYGIYLNKGKATQKIKIDDALSMYSSDTSDITITKYPIDKGDIIIHDFTIKQFNKFSLQLDGDHPITIDINFTIKKPLKLFRIGFFC